MKDAADGSVLVVCTSMDGKSGSGKIYNSKEETLFGVLNFKKMDDGKKLTD